MTQYRIYGVDLSPYSVKVRSWFRYKGVPHEWIVRSPKTQKEFEKYAKLPLIPVVVSPDDTPMQDSTLILEQLEQQHPESAATPDDPALAFIDYLLEEYADEWLNKSMFHYRWRYPVNQYSASARIADVQLMGNPLVRVPGIAQLLRRRTAAKVRARMIPRLFFVGSSDQTADHIEGSFVRFCALLENHLSADRLYMFGNRPAIADFALWGQLYVLYGDPMPRAIIDAGCPRIKKYIERVENPYKRGEWESLESLLPTLKPMLEQEVGQMLLPWSHANAKALEQQQETFSVELQGRAYSQKPQKYHARSLQALLKKYAQAADAPGLESVLRDTGVLPWLQA